ncbi:type II toxin-antitoxin system VapC family toxin [soil metagenome]
MPTNAERFSVDTSVAVAALDAGHAAHRVCLGAVRERRPGLAGHAAFETFSVLTRMPGPLSIDAPTARDIISRVFRDVHWLTSDAARALLDRLGTVGIVGGAVYDALVGEAARTNNTRLLTRDQRARRTYDLLGVSYELLDA